MCIRDSLKALVGISQQTEELRHLIEVIGTSDSTVLLLGDSGTGKEVVANALHSRSSRSRGPFIPVNCGAIPRDLLESELFGHLKGAFTGAISDRKGRFQLANKGTLFLDEIGDMPMELQVKLLRVLQERTIDPVGSLESLPIDVRVIAATHKNVEQLISQGLFREDLYYRLNVMPIEIVALKERKDDIPVLIQHFAENYAAERQLPISFTASSMSALLHYNWPGNVRELANLITRYTALYGGQQVDLDKVPNSMVPQGLRSDRRNATPGIKTVSSLLQRDTAQPFPNPDINGHVAFDCSGRAIDEVHKVIALAQGGDQFPEEGVRLKQHLLGIEKSLISQALEKAEGNVSKTARLLSLQRTTLIEKINKYGLSNLH